MQTCARHIEDAEQICALHIKDAIGSAHSKNNSSRPRFSEPVPARSTAGRGEPGGSIPNRFATRKAARDARGSLRIPNRSSRNRIITFSSLQNPPRQARMPGGANWGIQSQIESPPARPAARVAPVACDSSTPPNKSHPFDSHAVLLFVEQAPTSAPAGRSRQGPSISERPQSEHLRVTCATA